MTMADKNLHDIKIDELDNSKKTPLKNILTLLALLFIILVISVAITRLILNTDEEDSMENNGSTMNSGAIIEMDSNSSDGISHVMAGTAGLAAGAVAGTILSNRTHLTERNVSTTKDATSTESKKESGSKIKATLREHRDVKKEITTPAKHTVVSSPKHTTTTHHVVKKTPVHHTKEPTDKVVSSSKKTSSNHSHLGEKRAGYYIKVGTFKDTSNAVNKIKKTGLDYILIKPKNDKTTTRVLIGPFKSNWGAKQHLPKVKNNIAEGAYITRID